MKRKTLLIYSLFAIFVLGIFVLFRNDWFYIWLGSFALLFCSISVFSHREPLGRNFSSFAFGLYFIFQGIGKIYFPGLEKNLVIITIKLLLLIVVVFSAFKDAAAWDKKRKETKSGSS